MKVLHVVPSYYPAVKWGGPIWSTKAICDGIHAQSGMNIRVLTTDAASPIREDQVTPVLLPYPVHFSRRVAGNSIAPGLLARLPAAIQWADIVHLTAIYSFPTLPTLALARMLQKPVVWSPRGALQATAEWDDAPRQRMKHLFEQMAGMVRPKNTVLHVTSRAEALVSVSRIAGIETTLIPNCVDIPDMLPSAPCRSGAVRLLYLGRLHPKKGLDILFDAVLRMASPVMLDVYGTGDDNYVQSLARRAACSGQRIKMHGQVSGRDKGQAFAKADIFVLPSHSENFGIAVAEALAHGVPVITTTNTPWQGLDHRGCGRCIDLAQTDLAAEIDVLAKGNLAEMGAKGRAWMARDFGPEAMVSAFMDLYRNLVGPAGQGVPA